MVVSSFGTAAQRSALSGAGKPTWFVAAQAAPAQLWQLNDMIRLGDPIFGVCNPDEAFKVMLNLLSCDLHRAPG